MTRHQKRFVRLGGPVVVPLKRPPVSSVDWARGLRELWIEVFEGSAECLFGGSAAVVCADFIIARGQCGIGRADNVGGVFLVIVDDRGSHRCFGVAEMQA